VYEVDSVDVVAKPGKGVLMELEAQRNGRAMVEFDIALCAICVPMDVSRNSWRCSLQKVLDDGVLICHKSDDFVKRLSTVRLYESGV
jgi:hypothetical protein